RREPTRALPPVTVSKIRSTQTTIDFDVSRTGVPVMVKTSYYPTWSVDGADGPWRATPDFMVVVPTSRHVHLEFGTPPVEWVGRVLTLGGLAGLAALAWWGGVLPVADATEPRRRRWVRFSSRPRR